MYKAAIYIPYFPGFYDTILSPRGEIIQEELETDIENRLDFTVKSQDRLEDALDKVDIWEYFDNERYEQDLAIYFVEGLNDLIYSENTILKDISFEYESLARPRFYNYENDKINGYVNLPLDTVIEYMNNNAEEFQQYLKDNYSSRDGFTSFVPTNLDDFRKELKSDLSKDVDRDLGILVEFIIEKELKMTPDEIYEKLSYDLLEDVSESEYCDFWGFAGAVESEY